MMTGKDEEESSERSKWKLGLPRKTEELQGIEKKAKNLIVGAGARVLFYPTLLYNVMRNTFEAEFRWWDQIDQFLLLGAVPFPRDVLRLKSIGVQAVVTLNEPYETLVPTSMYKDHGINHLVIPTRDYLFAPSFADIQLAVAFINEHAERGEVTYVHCKAGRGRSTTVVLCYLVEHRRMTPLEALHYVRSKRPRVLLAAAQWKAVQDFSKRRDDCLEEKSLLLRASCRPVLTLPWLNTNSFLKGVRTCSPKNNLEIVASDDDEGTNLTEDTPVLVSSTDLVGYSDIQDAGCVNKQWQDVGVVYKLRLLAAKNVVSAAKASVAFAKLSSLWLGSVPQHGVLKAGVPVTRGPAPEAGNCKTMASNFAGQLPVTRIDVPVCHSGMVNC
ncbi:hypothetical protein O6H91_09G080000 [Diphasiastrum complanatum]|uniref:Uncharacterized protein n=2 Tax=Diphasiastrum complanatum TaxID=34168 RepID=A0ACC2CRA7_DIPCM|nr:hypothetical protein O6H91_09G080000 [Diphasiastrum complanatum]